MCSPTLIIETSGVDTANIDGHNDYWLAAQINGQDYYSGGW